MEELIPIVQGDLFSLKSIRDAVKYLYKSGLFADVQVSLGVGPELDLIFSLTKNLFVRNIQFRGYEDVSQKKIRDSLLVLQEGRSFSSEKLSKAVDEVKNVLENEGYFSPEIETSTDVDQENSQVDIRFDIRSARKYKVGEISFGGEILVSEAVLKKKMHTAPGKDFIPAELEEDLDRIREIYLEMDYQRVEVEIVDKVFEEETGTVSILLKVTHYEKIEIVVEGADIPLEILKPIWETRVFEDWSLSEGKAKIINYLREKNYLFPNVTPSIKSEDGNYYVNYKVILGEKVRILDMEIKGASFFTPSQIREELGIPEKISFFSKIDGSRLYELPREIEFLYRTKGFSETQAALNFLKQENGTKPIIFIEEGQQEIIDQISMVGSHSFPDEQLLLEIESSEEGAFFQPNIQRDVDRLENYYLNQGFRDSVVRAVVQQGEEGKYSVHFQIEEGRKVFVDNIIISGNEITQKRIVLRELQIKEGDLAFYDSIIGTKRRLEGLGIFTQVEIEEIPVSDDRVNLFISLIEGQRNYASLGLGIETKNIPKSFAVWDYVVRPRGTAEFIRSNIFGSAAQLSLVGQVSLKEQRVVASWEQPYFLGIPTQMFVNAWLEREERESYSFERTGFSLSTFFSLSKNEEMILLTTMRFARTTLFELWVSESEVDRQHFPFSTTSISGSLIWDKRDDPFNPERGFFLSSVLEWAYPLFNAESSYQRTFTKYQHFIPIVSRVTFRTTTRLGLGRGRMPIHERFFAGGSNSFRGVEFDELGPQDPVSNNPIGGKAIVLFNFELTFPIFSKLENLFGTAFFDTGNVFERRKQVSFINFQNAVGFGLRYRTPLGPIRFELGWNLNAPPGERKPLAFITIGNVF
ncbi:BamA/TamA family outer membrane protein [Acidobacteriota bacterium]